MSTATRERLTRSHTTAEGHVLTVSWWPAEGFALAECGRCGWSVSGADGVWDDDDPNILADLVSDAVACHRIGASDSTDDLYVTAEGNGWKGGYLKG